MRFIKLFLIVFIVGIGTIVYAVKMPQFVTKSEQNLEMFSTDTLEEHVRVLSEEMLPRTCEQPIKLQRSAAYIEQAFSKQNPNVETQNYTVNGSKFSNVISIYGPNTKEIIIIGAHYDAFSDLPGADDNASGVAGLLELGRALSAAELQTRVLLVAYSCEEPPYFNTPHMGSFIHADSIKGNTVKLMISLEMIGFFTEQPDSQSFPVPALAALYPKKGNFVAIVGDLFSADASSLKATMNKHTNLSVYSINAPASMPGIDFSDHRNYWAFDYPAIMVTDTAFFRNRNYHTAEDTFETLDYEKMREIVKGVYLHVISLANN